MEYNYNSLTISNKKASGKKLTAAEQEELVYSHNIIGAVEYRLGVCESYAKTYQMLLNYVGVDNIYIVGTDVDTNSGHAWNAVKMDNGTYYFVDATWDDKLETHRYFAKGYTVFDDNHAVSSAGKVNAEYFYPLPSTIPTADYNCQSNSPTLKTQMDQFSFYITKDNTVTITKNLQSAQKVTLPTQILGFDVKGIGQDAFFNSSALTEIVIPDGVTDIGSGAFFVSLKKSAGVTIPKSVKSIGSYAFGYTNSAAGNYKYNGDYTALAPKKITGFTISCYRNSAGYRYAADNGFNYILLDGAYLDGDADGSGSVDVSDVLIIQQFIAGWKVDIDEKAADIDGDGILSVTDALLVQQLIAGWNILRDG